MWKPPFAAAGGDRARARHGQCRRLAQLRRTLGQLDAACTTLRWLARDREGCVKLLATRVGD